MDSQRGSFPVNLLPHEVRARLLTEVGESLWLDILNYLCVRNTLVGFVGVASARIWVNGFTRSSSRPQLHVRVEETPFGSLVEYEVKYPLLGGILAMHDDDIPLLKALLPRLLDDARPKSVRPAPMEEMDR